MSCLPPMGVTSTTPCVSPSLLKTAGFCLDSKKGENIHHFSKRDREGVPMILVGWFGSCDGGHWRGEGGSGNSNWLVWVTCSGAGDSGGRSCLTGLCGGRETFHDVQKKEPKPGDRPLELLPVGGWSQGHR